jgi:hypothetical protein
LGCPKPITYRVISLVKAACRRLGYIAAEPLCQQRGCVVREDLSQYQTQDLSLFGLSVNRRLGSVIY